MAVVGFIFPPTPLHVLSESLYKIWISSKSGCVPNHNTRNTNENYNSSTFTHKPSGLFHSNAGTNKRVPVYLYNLISGKTMD